MANDYKRRGSQEKCPACGWRLDADAYRCPKCMIYFCFKCRRRVAATDPQYQCLNQQCQYYGKLLCQICTEDEPIYSEPTTSPAVTRHVDARVETEYGVGCFITGASIAVGLLSWLIWNLWIGLLVAAWTLGCGYAIALLAGWHIADVTKEVEPARIETIEPAKTIPAEIIGHRKLCIACKQPVEVLQEKKERW